MRSSKYLTEKENISQKNRISYGFGKEFISANHSHKEDDL